MILSSTIKAILYHQPHLLPLFSSAQRQQLKRLSSSAMTVIFNRSSTQEEDVERIKRKYREASHVFRDHEDVIKDLKILHDYGLDMMEWVHEYDLIDGVQANGFRSLLSMGIGLLSYAIRENDKNNLNMNDFKGVLENYRKAIPYIQRLRDETKDKRSPESSAETFVDFLIDYLRSYESIKHFYTKTGCFDLGPLGQSAMNYVFGMKARMNSPSFASYVRTYFDSEYRKTLLGRTSRSSAVSQAKSSAPILSLMRAFVPWYVNGWGKPDVVTDIQVPRLSKYLIKISSDGTSTFIEDSRNNGLKSEDILCRLIKKSTEEAEVLMINIHGGGFSMGERDSQDAALRRWVNTVPKFAAISIEYSLAPENKFPVALQECLDVYMFFADPNNQNKIRSLIGFFPKKILISGDSAGGTLTLGVTLALANVRKNFDDQVTLPVAIFPFYPLCTVYPAMKASFFINATSSLLMPPGLNLMVRSYVPKTGPKSFDVNENVRNGHDDRKNQVQVQSLSSFSQKLEWYTSTQMFPPPKPVVEDGYRTLTKEYPILRDSLLSPLFGDFSGLESVALYAYPCRMDGLLDECLITAAKWTGSKKVFVAQNLQHGWLNTGMRRDAIEGMDVIGSHIREIINI